MPRIPRLDAAGSLHHVMNRGARRTDVFGDDDSHLQFLHLLSQLPERFGVKVHAYAVMPNHFHLLLEAGDRGLGTAMQFVQSGYSRWLNSQRAWDGPVWKARYRSRVVEADDYLIHVLAYIHLNPVKAHLAVHVDRAHWTSHAAYTGALERPPWLTTARLLEAFGTVEALQGYVEEVRIGRQPGPDGFDPGQLWVPAGRTLPPASALPVAPEGGFSLAQAWEVLADVCGVQPGQLPTRSRSAELRMRRWLALWWLPKATGMRPSALSRELGVHKSTLSRAPERLRQLADRDPTLAREWKMLRHRLGDSEAVQL